MKSSPFSGGNSVRARQLESFAFPAVRLRAASAVPILIALIGVSATLRSVIAWHHAVPRLFPDEYIYAALGRSIGHGHLQIRGQTVGFPAILEPLVAAPIWRLFGVHTAYHLVQVENAFAASLAAIPAYLTAKALRLPSAYAIATAAYALLVPELVLVAYTSSDTVAYPLALTAIYLAVLSLDTAERRHQIGFLVFASLTTLARLEYVALVPAYLIAAAAIERRDLWRRHRIAFAAIAPVAVVFLVGFLGFYANERNTPLNLAFGKWFLLQLFLFTVATGTVLVPGAVAALTRPQGRRELGLSLFAGLLALFLFAEATAHAVHSSQFKERYVYVLSVLVPIGFGLYIKHGRPRRLLVVGISLVLIVVAARLPLSEYATATFKMDSQFLLAVGSLQSKLGTANASLAIAALTTFGALGAIALTARGSFAVPFVWTAGILLIATILAVRVDLHDTRVVQNELPRDLTWVNDSARGAVDSIETPFDLASPVRFELYWNSSIKHELLLGNAVPTDQFSAPKLRIGSDGTLQNASNEVLFHDYGTTGWPANAVAVKRAGDSVLWRAANRVRLRLLVEGRFRDGWMTQPGRIMAWTNSGSGLRVRFRVSLPRRWKSAVTVNVAGSRARVAPGQHVNLICSAAASPLDVGFSAAPVYLDPSLRAVTVRVDRIVVKDHRGGPPTGSSSTCTTTG